MRRPLWERTDPVIPKFHYDPEHDTNDDKEWSEMDFEDLQNSLARGGSIEDVAIFLCRRGTQDRVRKKADEMGWWPNTNALGAPMLRDRVKRSPQDP
jgi:hypothetical protein